MPVLILFLLGIIDVGRYMWSINELEKATQMGARMAVVTTWFPAGSPLTSMVMTLGQGAADTALILRGCRMHETRRLSQLQLHDRHLALR